MLLMCKYNFRPYNSYSNVNILTAGRIRLGMLEKRREKINIIMVSNERVWFAMSVQSNKRRQYTRQGTFNLTILVMFSSVHKNIHYFKIFLSNNRWITQFQEFILQVEKLIYELVCLSNREEFHVQFKSNVCKNSKLNILSYKILKKEQNLVFLNLLLKLSQFEIWLLRIQLLEIGLFEILLLKFCIVEIW